MNLTFADFWKLAVDSKLLAPQQCQQLHQDFSQIKGAVESGSVKTLAEWLVSRNVISRYQETILLAGRPGPFVYGDYRVYERIEGGRLANWFRAVHAPTGHPVILQFLTGAVTRDPKQWAAAAREAVANCSIISPHLQRWLDVVDLTTFKFVVCEDLRGQSVDERMRAGSINPQEACRWIIGAAQGLTHLHNEGRVHGEIRPGNLWLENVPNHPGQLKLLRDPLFMPHPLPLTEMEAAKADYLAPEFIQAGKEPDTLTDLYSLGCTFYALLAGNPPFAGGTTEQKMRRHATEAIRPLEQFGVPQPVAQLVTFLMAKNPAVRYQQAAVVAEQLTPFVDPQVLRIPAPGPPPTLAAYEAWIQQKRAVLAAKAGKAAATPSGGTATGIAVGAAAIGPDVAKGGFDIAPVAKGAKPPAKGVGVTSTAPAIKDTTDPKTRAEKEKTKQIVYGLVGAGVLAVIGLIAVNLTSGPKETSVVQNTDGTNPPSVVENGTNTNTGVNTNNVSSTDNTGTTVTPPKVTGSGTGGSTSPTLPPEKTPDTVATQPVGFQQTVEPDDGKLLWASPTTGVPVDLRGVPPEGQVFVSLRPAALLKTAEGERVLSALGPELEQVRSQFEAGSGFKLAEIDRLVISFHNNETKFPRVAIVAYPVEEIAADALLAKLGNPAATEEAGKTFYTSKDFAFAIPDAGAGRSHFIMSDPFTIKDGLPHNTAPPILRKEVERLRRSSDIDRHVTVLFYPNFLANADGAPLFGNGRERARGPLLWLLGDDLQAGSFSMHFDSQFYWEVRFISTLSRDKFTLASDFKTRMQQIPDQVLTYISEMNPPTYWRKMAMRFPPMISQLHNYTRVGVEDEAAVLNGVLPGVAAHNLVLGTELAIVTAPGPGGTAVAAAEKPMPKTIEEVLAVPTSFAFDNTSLEFAMRDLAAETKDLTKGSPVDFNIRILGTDLQLDGITRNMTIRDFKQENKSVGDVLTALVMKTSTNTDPASPDQKLIWVVGPDPDDPSKQIVLITTRKKAAERGNKLPAVFEEKKS